MWGYPTMDYLVTQGNFLNMHGKNVHALLNRALDITRLERLEAQHSMWRQQFLSKGLSSPEEAAPLDTFQVLTMLAYTSGHKAPALFHPFTSPAADGTAAWPPPGTQALGDAAEDALRCDATLALAKAARKLAQGAAFSSVRVGALAFIEQALEALKAVETARGLSPKGRALWPSVRKELEKEPESGGAPGLPSFFSFLAH